MNKVTVDLAEAEKRRLPLRGSGLSNNASCAPRYEGWVTTDYVGAQLRDDVAHFWQLDATKYELLDGIANAVVTDEMRLDELTATHYVLRKRRALHVGKQDDNDREDARNDPFWLQEKLFDVFLIHALPHWNGKGSITMSCYQFKQLVLKATSRSSKTTKSTHDFTVRVVLAFKTATPNSSGAGATFDEFLDALMDVATVVFPRANHESRESALEQLACKHLIPYYDHLERRTVHKVFPSWSAIDELVLVRPKVSQLLHRFAQPLFEIALAYTTTVSGSRHQRGLQFHEFSRMIHDTKPTSVPLNTLELCFCFIHCCRIELSRGFTTPSVAMLVATEAPGSLASLNAGADGSGRGVLEVSCAHAVHIIAYLALLSMPSLALTKPYTSSRDNQGSRSHSTSISSQRNGRISSKLVELSVKAYLHFMSLRLSTTGRATAIAAASASPRFASMKKDTTLPLVSVNFMQEFHRMHREDALGDYLSSCGETMRCNFVAQHNEKIREESGESGQQQQNEADSRRDNALPSPEDEEDAAKSGQTVDDDLGLEIDWGEDALEENEERTTPSDDESSPTDTQGNSEPSPQAIAMRELREKEVLESMMNDADEIYTFLVSELQRHAAEGRLDDTETVPQMLDIWVTAGQKYAQVINYLDSLIQDAGDVAESLLDRKARILERFGASLYVFAIQLLKSTSKVFNYEEIFHITNARVYKHVTADLWDGGSSAAFTTDLATETLSLASGKLGTACKLLEELHRLSSTRANQSEPSLPRSIKEVDDEGSDDEREDGEDRSSSCLSITERYMQTLLHRAYCLDVYGDVLGHTKRWSVDFDLGCTLEEDHDEQVGSSSTRTPETGGSALGVTIADFYTSKMVLSKSSSVGHFYREANRIYRFLLSEAARLGWGDASDQFLPALSDRLARVEFKLASYLPRGCIAEKHLLDSAVQHLSTSLDGASDLEITAAKQQYVSAIRALRTKFFQPESEKTSSDELGSDAIVPFYRFVIVAALREVDPSQTGTFTKRQLSQFNEICGRSAVSDTVMTWLQKNFDRHPDTSIESLTEKGVFQYFCWFAESDPVTFCEVLDLLTAKYTETPVSITSGIASHTGRESKAKSLRATLFNHGRQRASASVLSSTNPLLSKPDPLNGIADCVVVVSAKMTFESCGDISQTTSPGEVKLDPSVIDVLPLGADVPEELSKFCFPDDPFMSNEPLPPMTFDLVLTDITGARQYGSCIHFFEEKDPIDVLAMISGIQQGNKTASLPSWISLKEIQQRRSKTRFFIPKCVCILSRLPLFQTFRDCLTTLYRLSISSPPFPVESFLLNILEQIPVPTTPHSITSFTLVDRPGILGSLSSAVPPLFPAEVDFTLLFQSLSAENILKVYGFLLTEKKVVLCSRNVSILTPCAETLRALLYPFECQVVYIPVLPMALLDFVTAPVPFFMGTCSDHSIDRLTAEGVVVVYLDKDEVAEPINEVLPSLPEVRAKKLLQSLKKTSAWAISQTSRRHFGRYQQGELSEITSYAKTEVSEMELWPMLQQQDDLQEKWTELYVLFTTFVMRLLKDFRKYCHRGKNAEGRETTVFDRKAFLAMHPSQREFCVHLFQTQHFQRFIDTSPTLSEAVLQLAASDAEQSWRNVRSKSIMIRRGENSDAESLKTPTRQITQAPALSRTATGPSSGSFSGASHRRRPSGRHTNGEILAPFNTHIYDELRGIRNNPNFHVPKEAVPNSTAGSRPPLLSHGSSGTLMSAPRSSLVVPTGGNASSNLIVAARLRLEIPVENAAEQ